MNIPVQSELNVPVSSNPNKVPDTHESFVFVVQFIFELRDGALTNFPTKNSLTSISIHIVFFAKKNEIITRELVKLDNNSSNKQYII